MISLTSSPRITSPEIDLEAQQAEINIVEIVRAASRAGGFFPFLITVKVVTASKEDAEGAETNEIDIPGPHTSGIASPPHLVSAGQDINDDPVSVVSQDGGATSTVFGLAAAS